MGTRRLGADRSLGVNACDPEMYGRREDAWLLSLFGTPRGQRGHEYRSDIADFTIGHRRSARRDGISLSLCESGGTNQVC